MVSNTDNITVPYRRMVLWEEQFNISAVLVSWEELSALNEQNARLYNVHSIDV